MIETDGQRAVPSLCSSPTSTQSIPCLPVAPSWTSIHKANSIFAKSSKVACYSMTLRSSSSTNKSQHNEKQHPDIHITTRDSLYIIHLKRTRNCIVFYSFLGRVPRILELIIFHFKNNRNIHMIIARNPETLASTDIRGFSVVHPRPEAPA